MYTYSGKNALKNRLEKFSRNPSESSPENRQFQFLFSIMYFGNIFQEFSCVTTQFLKIALEIFSRKPPDSPPGFFDAINFKFKYLKKLTYEVGCDIMSKCTNPSPIDAT